MRPRRSVLALPMPLVPPPPLSEVSPWNYDAQGADWGTLRNASTGALIYPACGSGRQQSPIDLSPATAHLAALEPLARVVTATRFRIVTRPSGHPGFQVRRGGGDR